MRPAQVLIFGSPRAGTPPRVASQLITLELPLKALVGQDQAAQVWVSYTDSSYLAQSYALPPDLVQNIAGNAPLNQGALRA